MNRMNPLMVLKGVGIAHLAFALLSVIYGLIIVLVPGLSASLAPERVGNARVYMGIVFIANALMDFWYFWLIRRFVKGEGKGTLYMALSAFVVVGSLPDILESSADLTTIIAIVLSAVGLVSMYLVKRERQRAPQNEGASQYGSQDPI